MPVTRDLQRLVRDLAASDSGRRAQAAKEISKLGRDGRPAAAALCTLLQDEDPMVRAMAAAALGKIEAPADVALRALCAQLEDPVFPVRFWVVDALGRLGPSAAPALPDLVARLEDEHKAVRGAARIAVSAIRQASGSGVISDLDSGSTP